MTSKEKRPAGTGRSKTNLVDVSVPGPPVTKREPTDGAALLDEVCTVLREYVMFPAGEAADALTLWIAATHAQPAWEHATRFVLTSPVKRCGKTRAQELARELVHRPLSTSNISAAALVRSIDETDPPTLILDEADTVFGKRREAREGAEDLRGILNAGHARGWPYIRWNMKARQAEECPTFAMALLGGIGDLPDTIEDRAVVVSMRRRAPGEPITPFRRRRALSRLHDVRDRLHEWVAGLLPGLVAEPDMPVEDRDADKWESLVAVADAAGGHWPATARRACVAFCGAIAPDEATLGERLLIDLADLWGDDEGHLFTAQILDRLRAIEEAPWADFFGHPVSARDVARLLRPYKVSSRNIRAGAEQGKGYRRADLSDAWRRYVPGVPASPTAEPAGQLWDGRGTDNPSEAVPGAEQQVQDAWDAGTPGTPESLERAEQAIADAFGPPEEAVE